MNKEQQTLSQPFALQGVGIHTGAQGRITVHPAAAGAGRVFQVGGVTIPARAEYIVDTTRSTTLGKNGVRLSTVEHLLSALAGCGVDNAFIEVEGPEIPILDGSALPFVEAIRAAGLQGQSIPARVLRIDETVHVTQGQSEMRAEPAEDLTLEVAVDFDDWPQGNKTLNAAASGGILTNYAEDVAPARTFAFRREVEMLLAAGLAKGGSLDNALIISPPDGFSSALRVHNEWCAHKMLDVIGDLALADARLAMKITAVRPGHRLNAQFTQALIQRARTKTF